MIDVAWPNLKENSSAHRKKRWLLHKAEGFAIRLDCLAFVLTLRILRSKYDALTGARLHSIPLDAAVSYCMSAGLDEEDCVLINLRDNPPIMSIRSAF